GQPVDDTIRTERFIMSNDIKRLRVQTHPNSELRGYSLTARVADIKFYGTFADTNSRYPTTDSGFEKAPSDRDKQLIDKLYDLAPGVKKVGLDPYCVRIEKEFAFNWSEIENSVIDVILAHIGWERDEVEIDSPRSQTYVHVMGVDIDYSSLDDSMNDIDPEDREGVNTTV
ncbi:NifU N-terminal domain-containing protein, partial [Candidatus Saccharibacteria bacterium]|nr:NifU N-terminal domain-containing protein [Candidatus Saccharibacteria bacterium]